MELPQIRIQILFRTPQESEVEGKPSGGRQKVTEVQ
jgi:hypothetical protein